MLNHRPIHRLLGYCLFWAMAVAVGGGWAKDPASKPSGNALSGQSTSPLATSTPANVSLLSVTEPAGQSGTTLFVEHIRPVFERHCLICHSGQSKKSGLDLSSREALLRGGDTGPAIVPGNAKASLLFKVIAHEQAPAMPYKANKLSEAVIARIADWIIAGAPYVQSSDADRSNKPGGAQAPQSAGALLQPIAKSLSSPSGQLFVEQVRPVLEMQCLACHGGKFKQAGLSLATREALLRGSDNGPVIVPGDAKASLLVKKIKHEHEPGMPYQGKRLSEDVIAQIVEWINSGAPYDQPLKMPAGGEQVISQHPGSSHWAFKRPRRPAIPVVKSGGWVRNPVDAFLAAEHEKRGLKPLPEADQRVLLRRVYLDLVGLPPTREQMRAFLADRSQNAYENVVDQLLASPHYGERWGRHWMDIWRYSDWYGVRESDVVRNSQRHIWRWRDWIIESLNEDNGYDRMIVEMLAADEIAPNDPQTLRATGYLARNWYLFDRNLWLQETVDHTALGFLGLTLKCARCHDHKYDPIAQEEYYQFRAFFERHDVRTDRVPGQPDPGKDGLPRAFDAEPRAATAELPAIFAETYRFIRGNDQSPDKEQALSPGVPEILGRIQQIQPVTLPFEARYPDLRSFVPQDLLAQARADFEKKEAGLAKLNQTVAQAKQQKTALATQDNDLSPLASAPGSGETLSQPASPLFAAEAGKTDRRTPGDGGVSFVKEIRPLLEKNCFSCHGVSSSQAGLVLETLVSVLEGGSRAGAAVIPGNSRESPLILRLRGEIKPRMPLGKPPLSEEQISFIGKWIDQLPQDQPELVLRKTETMVTLAEKELAWARANLSALEARIVAEKAKYANSPNPDAEILAQTALKMERHANQLKAEESLWRAQQQLSDAMSFSKPEEEKANLKKVEGARKQLEAAVAALGQPVETHTPVGQLYPEMSTGRRLALARWIASRDNPLTARVAINHMWLRHFGKALVPSIFDFGLKGKAPTHPDLLDWLASEFMEKNWSMKAIHRLIVTSNTYRMQSSTPDPKHPNLSLDVENHYLWRMNPRRMEAEIVRDSVLHVAGQLDTTLSGPELDEAASQDSSRRSLYFRHTPDAQMLFLKLFDAASANECYERNESVVPQQALAMANSQLSFTQARLLARRLSEPSAGKRNPATDFVTSAFWAVLGRPPSALERLECEKFLRDQIAGAAPATTDPHLRARESLIHVLFNHNDFVTLR